MVTATPDMHPPAAPDPMEVGLFALSVANQMSGAVTSAMIHLGDRLGLFRARADAGDPLTSAELAERTGLAERWVREWAYNQAAAGLVDADTSGDAERFSLPPAAVPVLADETHEMNLLGMFHQLPQSMGLLESALPESFRTGIGHDYDTLGPEAAIGVERGFEPWMRNHLVDDLLPRLDGVVERLTAGAAAADVGCGAGAGVLRPRDRPLPADGSMAFVTTFDGLHDMPDPDGAARAIRAALADDGTWLVADIKAYDTFAENVERNPMAALMYGTSVLSCMSSALSEAGGAGLGTLGMSERRATEMAESAGFTRFRQIELDSPVNAFYEIRP